MANAVFTTKVEPVYDDYPTYHYHFPATYLKQAELAKGDLIVYYEPRREGADLSGTADRQCYFATAKLEVIEPDPARSGYFYARVSEYLEFDTPVPFKIGGFYPESALQKEDGSTNKGRFGRSVRVISSEDFQRIWKLGFSKTEQTISQEKQPSGLAEESIPYLVGRKRILSERAFRDEAFKNLIRTAYESTCAMTGLKLINGGGRCEIEAAHIRPVSKDGPDSARNGIALSRTIHWMFDRGILSVLETGEILLARKHVPDPVLRMLNPDGLMRFPNDTAWSPHPAFLKFHRENIFKG